MNPQPTLFDAPRIPLADLCDRDEVVVASVLNDRVGSERAMQVRAVAEATGLSGRRVQSIVRHLIVDHHAPVGTSMSEPYGYFLVQTDEERAAVVQLHERRALSELETMRAHDKMALRALMARVQTELLDGAA